MSVCLEERASRAISAASGAIPGFEPAIDQEGESHDHEKTADAEGGARVSAGQGDQDHQAQANPDEGNAAPTVSSGWSRSGLIRVEVLMGHGTLEAAGIDLRRGTSPFSIIAIRSRISSSRTRLRASVPTIATVQPATIATIGIMNGQASNNVPPQNCCPT